MREAASELYGGGAPAPGKSGLLLADVETLVKPLRAARVAQPLKRQQTATNLKRLSARLKSQKAGLSAAFDGQSLDSSAHRKVRRSPQPCGLFRGGSGRWGAVYTSLLIPFSSGPRQP